MQGGQQFINLNRAKGCPNRSGIITHELLHALGFHHMHSHTDRDQYIKIYWKNIKGNQRNRNFKAFDSDEVSDFDTDYDFYSIMHYPPHLPNGKRVIKPKKTYSHFEQFMGQRIQLSFGDIDRINNMYKCDGINGRVKSTLRRDPPINPIIRRDPPVQIETTTTKTLTMTQSPSNFQMPNFQMPSFPNFTMPNFQMPNLNLPNAQMNFPFNISNFSPFGMANNNQQNSNGQNFNSYFQMPSSPNFANFQMPNLPNNNFQMPKMPMNFPVNQYG